MTYNTSLKCTSRIIRVYTDTAHQAYSRTALIDMNFDLIEGDSGHSVSIFLTPQTVFFIYIKTQDLHTTFLQEPTQLLRGSQPLF